ncbi:MAG: lytic transglycosylase domain-containing protein [Treponemataceae bacterium]|nr:lytic transglycosylase domain-containing protein [Treponemataceae bacterium]
MKFRRCKVIFAGILLILVYPIFLCSCESELSAERKAQLNQILAQKDYAALRQFEEKPLNLVKSLGSDAAFYLGLHYLDAGDTINARILFEHGKQNASPIVALNCAQKLCQFGSDTERMNAAKNFYKSFPQNADSSLCIAREYFAQKQYEKVLNFQDFPSLKNFSSPQKESDGENAGAKRRIKRNLQIQNDLNRILLLSMFHTKNENFADYLEIWANIWTFSGAHSEFLKDFAPVWQQQKEMPQGKTFYNSFQNEKIENALNVMKFRQAIFNRNYTEARLLSAGLPPKPETYEPALLSDYCRSLLFGGTAAGEGAALCNQIAEKARDNPRRFLAWFYTGRFYQAAKNYDAALNSFVLAMQSAPLSENYDNALWYYLTCTLKVSTKRAIQALETYAPNWNDAEYFTDFLQTFAAELMQNRQWNDFVKAYTIILPYADGETLAQYGYVSARLLQENLAVLPDGENAKNEEKNGENEVFKNAQKQNFINHALNLAYGENHSALYYRVLAAYCLDTPVEEVPQKIAQLRGKNDFESDKNFEAYLLGFAEYSFEDRILQEFLTEYEHVGSECAIKLYKAVANAASKYNNPRLNSQALRIISYASKNRQMPLSREVLECLYPRPFIAEIADACSEFGVNDEVLFALCRTESFFDSSVSSAAGAVGLAQLMQETAADIARRLKVEEYDLLEPAVSARFGAWYLNNLIGRLDNSVMLALFSYNGGISRVRRWVKTGGDLPIDLFLETVPFDETRDYGRKVLAAATIYGNLYYGKDVHQIVKEVIGDFNAKK